MFVYSVRGTTVKLFLLLGLAALLITGIFVFGSNAAVATVGADIKLGGIKTRVTRYTYQVNGYGDYDGEVNVNLVIYRNTVIACDVSSADSTGFVKPLIKL